MNATMMSKEKNEVTFKMDFSEEEFNGALVKAYQETKDKFTVDGFRKGKAPRKMIENKYGEDVFFEDAVDILLTEGYTKALTDLDLNVVGRPQAELGEVSKERGFDVTIKVEVYPEFTVKDYMGVEVEKIEEKVSEEALDEELKKLQDRNSRMITVDRPVQLGDMVLLDYEGSVEGELFEGGKAERYPLKIGSNTFIPGFEEQLIGAVGESDVEVITSFPEEYHAEDLAGKEALFKCHIHEIKEKEIPALDDEFAKDISEWDTLEELKKATREDLEKRAQIRSEDLMKNKVVERIYEANDIAVPQGMIEDELDNMMAEFEQQLKYQGLDLEKYFHYIEKDPADFRDGLKDDAFKRVKTRMLMDKIVELEAIEATEEELDKQYELLGMQYQMDKDKIKDVLGPGNVKLFENEIKMKKAVDLVYENAKIS